MARTRLLYGTVLGLCVFCGLVMEEGGFFFTLAYALALLALVSLASALAAPGLVRLRQQVEKDTVFKNDTVAYTVWLENKGIFPYPRLFYRFLSGDVLVYGEKGLDAVRPLGRQKREYALRFAYRGSYPVGVGRLGVTDFMGLFRVELPVEAVPRVVVYPDSDDSFALSLRGESQSSALGFDLYNEDYTSVADVRKYEESDSLRKVHWKLSAKRGELLVKNFNTFEPGRTLLLLDAKKVPLPGQRRAAFEDKIVTYAASAVQFCAKSRLTAEFLYGCPPADQLVLDPGEEPERALRRLAELAFDQNTSCVAPWLRTVDQEGGGVNAIVFLAGLDEETHDGIRQFLSLGHNTLLYYFYPEETPPEGETSYRLDSLKAAGASLNRIPVELEPA